MRAVVIDDEAGLIAEIRDAFCPEFLEIIPCLDPGRAQESVIDNQPAIVILDLEMKTSPGARGVLERLRASRETADTPVIAVTSLPLDRRSITIPMHRLRVVARPFDPGKLRALIVSVTGEGQESGE